MQQWQVKIELLVVLKQALCINATNWNFIYHFGGKLKFNVFNNQKNVNWHWFIKNKTQNLNQCVSFHSS